jgi:hypothetical protein
MAAHAADVPVEAELPQVLVAEHEVIEVLHLERNMVEARCRPLQA